MQLVDEQKLISCFDGEGHVQSKVMPYLKYLICRKRPTGIDALLTIEDMMSWTNVNIVLPKVDPDDILTLFQTSGSTGLPKACAHTHRSVIAGAIAFADLIPTTENDIIFNDRPFTWAGGFPFTIITGETRVTRFGYDEVPEDPVGFLLDVIKRERCANVIALPPLLNSFQDRQDEIGDNWPVKVIASGGQPVSKKFANCVGKLCEIFVTVYGATEFNIGTGLVVNDPDDFTEYSIGYPHPGIQMIIVDEKGKPVEANQRGEIYIKTDTMFKGYYNDPDKTKASFTEDGWFRTDDIGFVSEGGLFFCEGRKSEMIISGGMNVAPTILETVLRNCQGVSRVVCVPVAHDVMYQVICACVILEDGSDVTEQDIRNYCDDVHNDKPRIFTVLSTYYLFLKTFPETMSGKISRKELTKMAAEKFLSV